MLTKVRSTPLERAKPSWLMPASFRASRKALPKATAVAVRCCFTGSACFHASRRSTDYVLHWCYSDHIVGTRREKMAGKEICANCGHIGQARKVTRGSFLMELVLWLCFIVPGLIYSIWRMTSKQLACPQCHASATMIPLDSPRGKKLQQDFAQ